MQSGILQIVLTQQWLTILHNGMKINMTFTLHRYIFRELLKVFVLAAIALTLILSLGSILQPVQDYGVGPRQVIHVMGYFLPITLTFVLPMAALFTAALIYGRFAGDNELDACKASGISLLTLVYPGLALAVIVAIANLLLSFYVMPYFVHLAEKSLKADARQILFRNIQRTSFYKLPPDNRYLIYADQADSENDILSGVVVIGVKEATVDKIITAETANVHFDPYDKFNEVQLTAYKTNQMGSVDDLCYYVGLLSVRKEFGSLLGDDIKFKRIEEMKDIRAEPTLFDPIAKLARQAFAQFIVEFLAQDIDRTVAGRSDRYYDLPGQASSVRFTAGRCTILDETQIRLSEGIVAEEYDSRKGIVLNTFRCEKAALHIEGDELAPTLTLDMYNARDQQTADLRMRYLIRGLALPEAFADKIKTESVSAGICSGELLSRLPAKPSPKLIDLQNSLKMEIQTTLLNIKAEIYSRLVFGIGVVPMILIGIALGIVNRGGHLLSAFGASCVPAAVLVVGIISGRNVTKNLASQNLSGMVLMWAGLAFLLLLTAVLYRRLLRH